MKNLLIVFAFAMSALSFQVNAATTDLGLIDDNASIGNSGLTGAFTDEYTFTVPANNIGGSFSATNSFVVSTNAGFIDDFKATLNGILFDLTSVGGLQLLSLETGGAVSTGPHTLVISGIGRIVNGRSSSYGGSIQIDTAENTPEVPVPAAVWLFGSALMGLFGVKRRQTA